MGVMALILWASLIGLPQMNIDGMLVSLSRDEMAIVERIAFLRQATEKLPESWQSETATNFKQSMTKAQLLSQINDMELSAADRWSLLLNNMADMKTPEDQLSASAKEWRASLQQLPALHRQINDKLNEFNERLKAGILLKLARKIQVQQTSSALPTR